MTKSKKHSPMQTETEPSIISQVPPEAMKDFIEGMVAMAQAKRSQGSTENPQESQASSPSGFKEVLMDPLPGVLSPMFKK
ncbi:hypothetical protein N9C80_07455 [Paracoccaceae bacterium]|nr:hypothetical protein [Paracoccaceae bacterium]